MAINFRFTDAGRGNSKRPRQKNDCTVRAYALVVGRKYDDVYEELAKAGRGCSKKFDIRKYLESKGWHWLTFSLVKGKPREKPGDIAKILPVGKYIVRVAKHVFAITDGVLCDESLLSIQNKCVYGILVPPEEKDTVLKNIQHGIL